MRTLKHKKCRTSKSIHKRRKGGGFGMGPSFVSPGNLVFAPYTGVGKDCPGNFSMADRPGYMNGMTPFGLPGFRGGAYGFPENAMPLNPSNGVGTSLPFSQLSCKQFRGGRKKGGSNSAFPVVQVGAADSMRYNAPTAGYRTDFTTLQAPSAIPGFTIQTPYNPTAFNQACLKGGSRRKRRKGGMLQGSPIESAYGAIQLRGGRRTRRKRRRS